MKSVALRAVDAVRDDLIELAKSVYAQPELGFEETRTARKVSAALERLGMRVERGIALTGLKAVRTFSDDGPTIAIIGELDALRVPGHPSADPDTGAAHACGHHAQLGQLVGVAAALGAPEVAEGLTGAVAFIATPAEEFIDVARRLQRRQDGELRFLSGKQEMIRLGVFDDVDMAMMVHTSSEGEPGRFTVGGTSNAHVVHHVRFLGKAAHAGGAPWEGVNALQAANVALLAVNSLRETFQESDTVRVHGIITRGGTAMNSIPEEVVYEGRVRGRNSDVVDEVSARVERCYKAGALALGAEVEIITIPGYMALRNDSKLCELFAANVEAAIGPDTVVHRAPDANRGGSTDMGDLSQLMPVAHPFVTAATGSGHGADYEINDYESAVIAPARAMAMTAIDLLADGAREGKAVIAAARPPMTRRQYVTAQEERLRVVKYRGK